MIEGNKLVAPSLDQSSQTTAEDLNLIPNIGPSTAFRLKSKLTRG